MNNLITPIIILFSSVLTSFGQNTNLSSFNFHKHAQWYCDTLGELDVNTLFAKRGQFFGKAAPSFQTTGDWQTNHWHYFELENPSNSKPLKVMLRFSDYADLMELYKQTENGQWDKKVAGPITPYKRLAFPDNKRVIPISLKPGERGVFFVNIRRFSKSSISQWVTLELVSSKQEKEGRQQLKTAQMPRVIFYCVFFAVLIFLLLFTFFQFLAFRRQGWMFLFYGIYLLGIFLFYLRKFEYQHIHYNWFFSYFSQWFYATEVPLSCLIIIAYMLFVNNFLNLPKHSSDHSKLLYRMLLVIVFLAVTHSVIYGILGPSTHFIVFNWSRIVLFIIALYFITGVLWKVRTRFSFVILIGTIFIVLGGMFGLLDDMFGGEILFYKGGTWRVYYSDNKNIILPFYDFKIGVLFEVICFSIGLTLKIREIRLAHQSALETLEEEKTSNIKLQKEMLRLISSIKSDTPSQGDSFLFKARKVILTHINDEEFDVAKFADAMNLSRSQLFRKLMLLVGKSPLKYTHFIRITFAKDLLKNTDKDIAEIAYAVGFKEHAHFSKVFKKEEKISPSEFRNRNIIAP